MGKNRNKRPRPGRPNTWQQDKNRQQDRKPPKDNELFKKYYQGIEMVPENEWDDFYKSLQTPLPAAFRITEFRSQASDLLQLIKSEYFSSLASDEDEDVAAPRVLPWYPNEMGWSLNLNRQTIRKTDKYKKLHAFMVAETASGNITRQEAVSMIPPLVMDIQADSKVLDMCAAPGSKTSQILELLNKKSAGEKQGEGFVIANDKNNKRCYLMVHQVKRLDSPNFLVTNHDATQIPNFRMNPENEPPQWLKFDRILADVPCSGDGTMRKNPDVWWKWTTSNSINLHNIQRNVLQRGINLLAVGGRIVYSTCSMNPVEDEAVVASVLRECEGTVEILDVASELPGLKFSPGLSTWKLMSKNGESWYSSFEDLPATLVSTIRPSMFPPSKEEAEKLQLNKCMRVLPHHQDTGGFFIAVLKKTSKGPVLGQLKPRRKYQTDGSEKVKENEGNSDGQSGQVTEDKTSSVNGKSSEVELPKTDEIQMKVDNECETKSKDCESSMDKNQTEDTKIDSGVKTEQPLKDPDADSMERPGCKRPLEEGEGEGLIQRRERRLNRKKQRGNKNFKGFWEDPFIFLDEDNDTWQPIKEFYGIADDFPNNQMMVRNTEGKKRNLYFVSRPIMNIAKYNKSRVKFINMGVKIFGRSDSVRVKCSYRINSEGLATIVPYMNKRKLDMTCQDVIEILKSENPYIKNLSENLQTQFKECGEGGIVFIYTPKEGEPGPENSIELCGWRGKVSCRAYMPKHERAHFLQICGVSLAEDWKPEDGGKPTDDIPMDEEKPVLENVDENDEDACDENDVDDS